MQCALCKHKIRTRRLSTIVITARACTRGGVGGGTLKRLLQKRFLRLLSKIDTMCLWIYKAYLCLTKTFYVEYSRSTVLKTGFSAVLSLDFVLVNFDSFSWGQFCLKLGYFFLTYLELSNLKYQTWFYLKIFFHFGTVSRQSQVNTSKISLFSRFLHFGAI